LQRRSAQPVGAAAEEIKEAEVAEDLELLADFVEYGRNLAAKYGEEIP